MKLKQRAKSAKMGKRTFEKGYFNKHQDLLVFEEGKKYDYTEKDPNGFTCIRQQSPGKPGTSTGNPSPEKEGRPSSKPRHQQKLFSQR
jgi:hypothetical protein